MVKPHCSNFWDVWIFFISMVQYCSVIGYCKFPKYSDTQKICCNHSKIWTMWLYYSVMSPNDADGMANIVDPDHTAPLGAVWWGSALFAQAYSVRKLRIITVMFQSPGAAHGNICRVAMVREKCLENEKFSWSGKSRWILLSVREIWKFCGKSGKSNGIYSKGQF